MKGDLMRGLFFALVLAATVIVCLGFYQGWFHLGSENTEGKSNVTLSVDTDKLRKDKNTALADIQGAERQIKNKASVKDKASGPADKPLDGTLVTSSPEKLIMTSSD